MVIWINLVPTLPPCSSECVTHTIAFNAASPDLISSFRNFSTKAVDPASRADVGSIRSSAEILHETSTRKGMLSHRRATGPQQYRVQRQLPMRVAVILLHLGSTNLYPITASRSPTWWRYLTVGPVLMVLSCLSCVWSTLSVPSKYLVCRGNHAGSPIAKRAFVGHTGPVFDTLVYLQRAILDQRRDY